MIQYPCKADSRYSHIVPCDCVPAPPLPEVEPLEPKATEACRHLERASYRLDGSITCMGCQQHWVPATEPPVGDARGPGGVPLGESQSTHTGKSNRGR